MKPDQTPPKQHLHNKHYRNKYDPKQSMVNITRKCLHDTDMLIEVLAKFAN